MRAPARPDILGLVPRIQTPGAKDGAPCGNTGRLDPRHKGEDDERNGSLPRNGGPCPPPATRAIVEPSPERVQRLRASPTKTPGALPDGSILAFRSLTSQRAQNVARRTVRSEFPHFLCERNGRRTDRTHRTPFFLSDLGRSPIRRPARRPSWDSILGQSDRRRTNSASKTKAVGQIGHIGHLFSVSDGPPPQPRTGQP